MGDAPAPTDVPESFTDTAAVLHDCCSLCLQPIAHADTHGFDDATVSPSGTFYPRVNGVENDDGDRYHAICGNLWFSTLSLA